MTERWNLFSWYLDRDIAIHGEAIGELSDLGTSHNSTKMVLAGS